MAVLGLSLVQQVFPKDPVPQTAWLSSLAQCTELWLVYFPPAFRLSLSLVELSLDDHAAPPQLPPEMHCGPEVYT